MKRNLLLLLALVFAVSTLLVSCNSTNIVNNEKSNFDYNSSETQNSTVSYQEYLQTYKEPETSVLELCQKHLSEKEIAELTKFIDNIDPEISPIWSGFQYDYLRCDSDKLTEIGIKGLPVLLAVCAGEIDADTDDRYKSECKTDNRYASYLANGFYALCRTDWHAITNNYGVYDDLASGSFVSFFYNCAKTDAAQIIASDKSTKEKLDEMKFYGILVLPEVVAEISKGNEEYAEYFTTIGLHLSVPEFMNLIADSKSSDSEAQRYKKVKTADGAKDFNYKAWLSENEEDLNNLFKFLDAYCAEYEAEQNK